jgi:hypothetical protein
MVDSLSCIQNVMGSLSHTQNVVGSLSRDLACIECRLSLCFGFLNLVLSNRNFSIPKRS